MRFLLLRGVAHTHTHTEAHSVSSPLFAWLSWVESIDIIVEATLHKMPLLLLLKRSFHLLPNGLNETNGRRQLLSQKICPKHPSLLPFQYPTFLAIFGIHTWHIYTMFMSSTFLFLHKQTFEEHFHLKFDFLFIFLMDEKYICGICFSSICRSIDARYITIIRRYHIQ